MGVDYLSEARIDFRHALVMAEIASLGDFAFLHQQVLRVATRKGYEVGEVTKMFPPKFWWETTLPRNEWESRRFGNKPRWLKRADHSGNSACHRAHVLLTDNEDAAYFVADYEDTWKRADASLDRDEPSANLV